MNCTDFEREWQDLDDPGLFSPALDDHLRACAGCARLVREVNLLRWEARQLVEAEQPPARLWANIQSELSQEGVLRVSDSWLNGMLTFAWLPRLPMSVAYASVFFLALVGVEYVRVSPVALPWPTYLRSLGARQIPLATSGWQEDIHDPHNWYVPYLIGTYGSRFNVPQELKDKYAVYIAQGVGETDPATRAEIYLELNQIVYEDAPLIVLSVANGKRYEPLYLHGWFEGLSSNPLISPFYFADFTKD
jgi:hypothetical protein